MKVSSRYAVFAPHHNANAWLALGWMPDPAFERCYHGQFSVLCVWICDCEMRRPSFYEVELAEQLNELAKKPPEAVFDSPEELMDHLYDVEFQIECQRDHDDNREGGRYGEGFW